MRRKLITFSLIVGCGSMLLPKIAAAQTAPPRSGDAPAKDYSASPIVTRMMAFDKDKDGKLTKEEVTDSRLQNLFTDADTNKDGIVTKEELMALAAKMDADMPAQGRGGDGPGRGGDGPGRGRGPGGPGGRGGPPGGPAMLPIIKALDADGNGELSAKEIDNAPAALRSLDKNKDGKLTREEMFGEMPGGRPGEPARAGGREAAPQGDRGQGSGGPEGRGPGGGPGGRLATLPIFKALDADGNGELSASEIDNAATALRSLDKNKDDKLTRDELFGEMPEGRGGRGGSAQGGPGGAGAPGGAGPRRE